MHFDGSKMRSGLGAGIVLSSPKGDQLRYALQIHFAASNNAAEYEALVHGLPLAKEPGIRHILCYSDPDLVVQQCSGEWDSRDANMASYHAIPSGVCLEHLHKPSPDSEFIFIPDDPVVTLPNPDPGAAAPSPGTADPGPGAATFDPTAAISNPAPGATEPDPVTAEPGPAAAMLNLAAIISNPGAAASGSGAAALEPVMVAVFTVVRAPSWARPISEFLENGVLPMDEPEAQQIQRQASAYSIINNELVKRSATGIFQRCVEQDKGVEILLDVHEGECGHHAASSSLVAKDFRHALWTTPITWPFAVWGLDMVGPFKTARGSMTHLLVAVDKFPKWTDARPIKKLDGLIAIRFIKDITVRYGVPHSIIADNDTNFAKGALAQYCSVSGIRLDLACVAYP
ncbi:uncharacterized protein [Aegilops tauschii subsp. strangulata]|uniref:uncharacterized protein n=1 Tax=Aegilops tauschii subsp. strangulata TaxID=200361 RepID=UPI00098AF8E1|nr:uncharacterized protein LOC109735615 [Aegilops tauschii subsp. strangulata]